MSGSLGVTILGCDGSYPGPGGAGSGYLVDCGSSHVWIDAGPGTLANLQRHIDLSMIDAIVVTHEHVDHWSDLEHLAVACHYILERPPIPLYSCTDLGSLMRVGPAAAAFAWQPIGPETRLTVGPLAFSFSRTDHSVETLAVRVEGSGRCLGYSADSGPAWGLVGLGAGLDLALCEATFLSDMEGSLPHLSARQAGQTAREAGVGRLVLTHLWPGTDPVAARHEAEAAFGRPVEMAEVGRRFEA